MGIGVPVRVEQQDSVARRLSVWSPKRLNELARRQRQLLERLRQVKRAMREGGIDHALPLANAIIVDALKRETRFVTLDELAAATGLGRSLVIDTLISVREPRIVVDDRTFAYTTQPSRDLEAATAEELASEEEVEVSSA